MWTITTSGFYSTVRHETDPGLVVVRCRRRADMDVFARFSQAVITFTRDRDYPYRVVVRHELWAGFLFREAMSIDYPNFKDEIALDDPGRARLYALVWQTLMRLEREEPWPNGETGYERRTSSLLPGRGSGSSPASSSSARKKSRSRSG